LERQQLVGRIMARGELGPEVAGSSR
jgi:hypothetical protein